MWSRFDRFYGPVRKPVRVGRGTDAEPLSSFAIFLSACRPIL